MQRCRLVGTSARLRLYVVFTLFLWFDGNVDLILSELICEAKCLKDGNSVRSSYRAVCNSIETFTVVAFEHITMFLKTFNDTEKYQSFLNYALANFHAEQYVSYILLYILFFILLTAYCVFYIVRFYCNLGLLFNFTCIFVVSLLDCHIEINACLVVLSLSRTIRVLANNVENG